MVASFVLDCSVTIAMCLKDERSAYARKVEEALRDTGAVVPALWPYEVANALVMAERRHRLSPAERDELLAILGSLGIVVVAAPAVLPHALIALAQRHKLTADDAAYLELAVSKGLPLATTDSGLARAAKAARVPLFKG
ncbi:MAG: type II toxin-antitoxin system VapC family toxin [Alphaproteobacteria bacterium]|nr:type II toxin-antitoxin system VapC family toxin [Alphaproteobacteria bacterium]